MHRHIYVVAETRQGSVTHESLEVFGFVEACLLKTPDEAFIPGDPAADEIATLLQTTGVASLHLIDTGQDDPLACDIVGELVAGIIQKEGGFFVCLPHSTFGLGVAAVIASRLDAACFTGVEGLTGGLLSKTIHQGRYAARLSPLRDRVVCTISGGRWDAPRKRFPAEGKVVRHQAHMDRERFRLAGIREGAHKDGTLMDADVIVAVGRGFGSKDNVFLAYELASLFPRSAVGASRGACDMRLVDYARQIGVTGLTVAPRLYIACGISGAVQHVSGIKGAKTVVAVNTDPCAPIFRIAHVCIVEDVLAFLPLLIEEIRSSISSRQ